jgi:hypothetical protein
MAFPIAAANSLGYGQDPAQVFERTNGEGSHTMTVEPMHHELAMPSSVMLGGVMLDRLKLVTFEQSDVNDAPTAVAAADAEAAPLTLSESEVFAAMIEGYFAKRDASKDRIGQYGAHRVNSMYGDVDLVLEYNKAKSVRAHKPFDKK